MLLPFYKLTGDALEMSAINEKEFFIKFDQTLPCNKGSCERLTNWGHAVYWNDGKELMLFPFCWEHGFALRDFVLTGEQLTAKQIKEQYASVERFVVGYHGGKGTAKVIGSYDPQEVPRFTSSRLEEYETLALYETWQERMWAGRSEPADSRSREMKVLGQLLVVVAERDSETGAGCPP